DRHEDDESEVEVVAVAQVAIRGGESRHRYRCIRQGSVRLRRLRDVGDRVNLIHCRGAEGIEFALYQVPHRMPVRRYKSRGCLLEIVAGQQPRGNIESRHRWVRRVALQRLQVSRRFTQPSAHLFGLVDEVLYSVGQSATSIGEGGGALL